MVRFGEAATASSSRPYKTVRAGGGSVLVRFRFGKSCSSRTNVPPRSIGFQMSSLEVQSTRATVARGPSHPGWPGTALRPDRRARISRRLRIQAAGNAALCDDDHRRLTNHERTWRAARFAGYRAVGNLLYEHRCCPRCKVTISRPTRFIDALCLLLAELQSPQQPNEIVTHSASLLLSWAGSNLPMHLGIASLPDKREQAEDLPQSDERTDWRRFGLDLRQRREAAGLTREQLCTLAGIAHATVRNIETGRHRPTARILRRLVAVPALRLSEARDLVGKDSPP